MPGKVYRIKSFKHQGHKAVRWQNGIIFGSFISAAISGVGLAPVTSADLVPYDFAKGIDNSGVPGKHFPPFYGMRDTPSGGLPSELLSSVGSFVAGKRALVNPHMISFSNACLAVWYNPRPYDMLCESFSWTVCPQRHTWGAHKSDPICRLLEYGLPHQKSLYSVQNAYGERWEPITRMQWEDRHQRVVVVTSCNWGL